MFDLIKKWLKREKTQRTQATVTPPNKLKPRKANDPRDTAGWRVSHGYPPSKKGYGRGCFGPRQTRIPEGSGDPVARSESPRGRIDERQ